MASAIENERGVVDIPTKLDVRITDDSGKVVSVDSGTDVLVTVTDPDGNDVVTDAVANRESTGHYTYTLAAQSTPDQFDVTWEATVDGSTRILRESLDIVYSRMMPLAEMRAHIENERSRAGLDPAGVDANDVRRALKGAEDTFHRALLYAPYRRSDRADYFHERGPDLVIPDVKFPLKVYSLSYVPKGGDFGTTDEQTVDPADLQILGRRINWRNNAFPNGIHVKAHLSHGRWTTPPADIKRAGRIYGAYIVRASDLPERATEVATEGAVFSLGQPSSNRPTGLPEVDGVLLRYRISAWV